MDRREPVKTSRDELLVAVSFKSVERRPPQLPFDWPQILLPEWCGGSDMSMSIDWQSANRYCGYTSSSPNHPADPPRPSYIEKSATQFCRRVQKRQAKA